MPEPHGAHRNTVRNEYGVFSCKPGGTQSYHCASESQTTVTFRRIPIYVTSAFHAFPTPAPHGAHRNTVRNEYGVFSCKPGGTQSYHCASESQTTATFRRILIYVTSAFRAFPTPVYRTVNGVIQSYVYPWRCANKHRPLHRPVRVRHVWGSNCGQDKASYIGWRPSRLSSVTQRYCRDTTCN